jgi:hypothetical protein
LSEISGPIPAGSPVAMAMRGRGMAADFRRRRGCL